MTALARKNLSHPPPPPRKMSLHEIQMAVENIHLQRDIGKLTPEEAEQQIRDLLNEQTR